MLRFFRHIRKTLLENLSAGQAGSKIRTYMLYAIGEILLVVIGILIALQVNNWNQTRLDRNFEVIMLTEISSVLEQDISNMENSLIYLSSLQHSISELASIKNDPAHPRDSLMHHFQKAASGGIGVVFNYSPYEALKSSGLDKVTDPELRKSLSRLYELQLVSVKGWINEIIRDQLMDRADFVRGVFKVHVAADSAKGIRVEYEQLPYEWVQTSPEFETFLSLSGSYIPLAQRNAKFAIEAMKEVENQIQSFLN